MEREELHPYDIHIPPFQPLPEQPLRAEGRASPDIYLHGYGAGRRDGIMLGIMLGALSGALTMLLGCLLLL